VSINSPISKIQRSENFMHVAEKQLSESEMLYLDNHCYIGIDPGITGAIGVLDEHGNYLDVYDMPVIAKGKSGKQQIDAAGLYKLIKQHGVIHAFVEQVGAMPGQGVSSMFSLGDSVGCIRAVLCALMIPTQFIPPQSWKRGFKLTADKEQARSRAVELFPQAPLNRKKDAGRAEALLIARFGWLTALR
jgi:crossover junction endodeoxyribonuclease RuvC